MRLDKYATLHDHPIEFEHIYQLAFVDTSFEITPFFFADRKYDRVDEVIARSALVD